MFNELMRLIAFIYIYIYIGGISDRHCLNLVLDVTKLYEIYFSHAFWLWEQHIFPLEGPKVIELGLGLTASV